MSQRRRSKQKRQGARAPADRTAAARNEEVVRQQHWRALLVLAFMCVALYGRTVTFGFTRTDDTVQLVDHARFVSSLGNLPAAFTQPFFSANGAGTYYRPIVTLTYMLDAQWGGSRPFPYHVTNVALHLLAAWLFFLLARRLGFATDLALAAAAIVAVHPALAEAVAWAPGRGDSLVGIWLAGAMLLLLRFRETGKIDALFGHLGLVLLAFFTKEAAIAFPAVFLAYLFLVDDDRRAWRDRRLWLGWGVALVIWVVFWRNATAVTTDQTPVQRLAALFQHLPVLLMYLGKAVFPRHLAVLAIERDTSWIPGAVALIPLAAAGYWLSERSRRVFLFGLLAYLLLLLPSLPVSDYLILEIRLYAPLMVLLIGLLAVGQRLYDRHPGVRTVWTMRGAIATVVIGLAVVAFRYSGAFRDPTAFTAQAVVSSPHSALAHLNRGIAWQLEGRVDEAEKEYTTALSLDARHVVVHNNLGLIDLNRGNLPRAEKLFREELAVNPTYDKAHFNLALALTRQGRAEDAARSLREAVRYNPDNVDALEGLVQYYLFRGDPGRAEYYRTELRRRRESMPRTP